MRNIKKYGSLLLLSVVLLAACSKQKVQPKSADVNSEDVQGSRGLGCITVSSAEDLLNIKN